MYQFSWLQIFEYCCVTVEMMGEKNQVTDHLPDGELIFQPVAVIYVCFSGYARLLSLHPETCPMTP